MEQTLTKKRHRKKTSGRSKRLRLKSYVSSDDEEVDLTQKLYSISHYIEDKKEMIRQAFSVMSDAKIQTMLPPYLKGVSSRKLKEMCLSQLTAMSSIEINRVLKGAKRESQEAGNVPRPETSDSDSSDETSSTSSDSSIEVIRDQGEETRTLLDILEQEMQAIAFSTVLKQGAKSNLNDLNDNVECSPEHSSSDDTVQEKLDLVSPALGRKENNLESAGCAFSSRVEDDEAVICLDSEAKDEVELICLDSEGEEDSQHVSVIKQVMLPSPERAKHTSNMAGNERSMGESDGAEVSNRANDLAENTKERQSLLSPLLPVNAVNLEAEEQAGAEAAGNIDGVITEPQLQTASVSKESFMVQVFGGGKRRNRVVKKVSRNMAGEDINCNKFETQLSSEKSVNEVIEEVITLCNVISHDKKKTCTKSEDISPNSLTKLPEVYEATEGITNDVNSSEEVDKPGVLLHGTFSEKTDVSENEASKIQSPDKEEGEISEEESEDDVEIVKVVQDGQRSPTVFLSSGEDNQNQADTVKRTHRRTHKHRKGSERDRPEKLRRSIEKRGNRSYRRRNLLEVRSLEKSCVISPAEIHNSPKEKVSDQDNVITSEDTCNTSQVKPDDTLKSVTSADQVRSSEDEIHSKELKEGEKTEEDNTKDERDKSKTKKNDSKPYLSPEKSGNGAEKDTTSSLKSSSHTGSTDHNSSSDAESEPDQSSSWADRWAKKKDFKKVVETSKIYANVRKRIITARKEKSKEDAVTPEAPALPSVPPLVFDVEGSVQEYQMLQGMNVGLPETVKDSKDNQLCDSPGPVTVHQDDDQVEETETPVPATDANTDQVFSDDGSVLVDFATSPIVHSEASSDSHTIQEEDCAKKELPFEEN